jgi:hypothetical protein
MSLKTLWIAAHSSDRQVRVLCHRIRMMFQMGPTMRSINPASKPAAVLTGNPFH